jgi:hypothetical protein
MRIPRQMLLAGSTASLSLLLVACGGGGGGGGGFPWNFGDGGGNGGSGGDGGATGRMEVRTLSTRADLVSGGDVLVELIPEGGNASGLKVTLNGSDITGAFAKRADGRITGLATGLAVGSNTIKASTTLSREATLTVVNAPRSGPVLSSTQFTPYVCATPAPTAGAGATPASNASGLSTNATDAQCSIAAEFKLFYRTLTPVTAAPGDGGCAFVLPDPSPATAGGPVPPTPANSCLQPYVAGTTSASAVASTTTTTGATVPYIVRVERGTINRGIYDIAVLFDPAAPWTATAPQPQWNRKLLYSFGAGTGFPRLQFRSSQNWADDAALSRGFMVVDNSMTDSQLNGNRYLVAETTLMMKEHVIDSYGEVLYMMGNGGSGGAINQNSVASLLPGVIDGTQLGVDFADSETTAMEVMDCVQLVNFYQSPAWTALQAGSNPAQVNAKKKAINGHLDHTACHGWLTFFGGLLKAGNYTPLGVADNATGAIVPTGAPTNNCQLPASLVYDPASNPDRAALRHHRRRVQCLRHDCECARTQRRARVEQPGQRRHPVRPQGAEVGCDFRRGVRHAQREGRRPGHGRQPLRSASIGRYRFAVDRLPRRARLARRQPRQGGDDRPSRLRRNLQPPDRAGRYPPVLAQLLAPGAHRCGSGRTREPCAVAVRSGGHAAFGDCRIVPRDGCMAHRPRDVEPQGMDQRGAHPATGGRRETGRRFGPVLPVCRHDVLDQGAGHGGLRRRSGAAAARLAAPGRRWTAHGRHPEMPVEAAGRVRLHTRCLLAQPVVAPAGRLCARRMRLEQAGRGAGADVGADDFQGRHRRQAAGAAAGEFVTLAVGRTVTAASLPCDAAPPPPAPTP